MVDVKLGAHCTQLAQVRLVQTALGRDLLKCGMHIHIREKDPHVRLPLAVSVEIRKPSEQLVGVLELREVLELA